MAEDIFILTTAPIGSLGGMERFLQYVTVGFKNRGYKVRIFHDENTSQISDRLGRKKGVYRLSQTAVQGLRIGRAVRRELHPGVRLVLSNSLVGWYPLGTGVKHAHFFHGTYRGQAEAIRPFITRLGYLKLKWWDAMVLERSSGKGKIALCCSESIRAEIQRFFGYDAKVMWYPIDLTHFRQLDKADCRRQLKLQSENVGIYVGSSHPMKGLGVVEHIARKFPDVAILLAIRGPVPDSIRLLPNTRVYQNASYDLLPILYNAADFSICPSRYDPFPFVVSEALASGTPVVASPHGASLTFYTGPDWKPLLAQSTDDLEGFEAAVRRVLLNPQKWRALVESSLRPRLEEMISPERWWKRFLEAVQI